MSQKLSRKGAVNEDKDKRQTDSPVKEMKKKMAANAEKEKQAAEKEKNAEKAAEKVDKNVEKVDKSTDKKTEKVEKNAEKKADKIAEKKSDVQTEKKEDGSKGEKTAKTEKQDPKKPEPSKSKQNGNNSKAVHNGVTDVTLSSNGCTEEVLNGTVKVTRTPETPRPASDKQSDKDTNTDDSKDSKVLKLKDDTLATDRKLRSSDSPKPQEVKKSQDTAKKPQEKPQDSPKLQEKTLESPKKQEKAQESPKKTDVAKEQENEESMKGVDVPPDAKEESEKIQEKSEDKQKEVEVVIEIESTDEEPRKPDTNYSKSRVKVSPYRRSMRIADQTTSSVMANYTGNNTTMEMDITETSSFLSDDSASLDDSSYLRGLRSIRGRNSYKPLKEMNLRHINRSVRSAANISASEQQARPTGTVVGRKRKQDTDGDEPVAEPLPAPGKRARLLERLALPFRRTVPSLPAARRPAEIVGINTDLPLTAPVSPPASFDPETLKPHAPVHAAATPAHAHAHAQDSGADADSKRCIIM